jgi:protein-tyrosine phosphatase
LFSAQRGISDLRASSAGTQAAIGQPIYGDAARVLRLMGGEASGFSARPLTRKIAGDSDLVLTMTREHREKVLELAPRQLRWTFTLSEASYLVSVVGAQRISDLAGLRPLLPANLELDIRDPIGGTPEMFEFVGAQIAGLLSPILDLCADSAAQPDR